MTGQALLVTRPGEIGLAERGVPRPGPGEALIRPVVVGLCGTDLELAAGQVDPAYVRYPLVLGHEWSGVVEAVGPGVPEGLAGALVVGEGIVPCGTCPRCREGATNLCLTYDELGFTRDGAAASHLLAPASLLHPLAEGVSPADGALVEPAAVVWRGLTAVPVKPGQQVLVVGDGAIALLAVRLLSLWSPARIVLLGRREAQAGLALTAGTTAFTTDAAEAGTGYDVVVEAAGAAEAVLTALAAARRGGAVLLLGLPPHGATAAVPADDLVNNDLAIRGSFSYTSAAWREVTGLLNSGRLSLSWLITHRFGLDQWLEALDTLRGASSAGGPPASGPAASGPAASGPAASGPPASGAAVAPTGVSGPGGGVPGARGKVVLEVRS